VCGGRLWQQSVGAYGGYIPYRIDDPNGEFSDAYKGAIRAAANAWVDASEGLVRIVECPTCHGRVIVVVPGTGDGIVDQTRYEEVLPMPVNEGASPPLHVIAHQWGHAIGLGHTYERADRDRYVRFDPAVWCGPQRAGLPPTCAYGPDQPGVARVPSDTFGVYDEKSKMNAFGIDGVCGNDQPDPNAGMPTAGDGSAVEELYLGHNGGWLPFQPIGRSVSPTEPLDYQPAPGVDPVGTPAITEWSPPAVEIFVRGTDHSVYAIHNVLSGPLFLQWSPWTVVAADVDADPAVTFLDANTLILAVREQSDGAIRLRARTKGTWGPWASLGAPAVGAGSAPAIAAMNGQVVMAVVRGNDGLQYAFGCTDPETLCATSAGQPDAWKALVPLPPDTPTPGRAIGKPSIAYMPSGRFYLTAVADDYSAWLIGSETSSTDFGNNFWVRLPGVDIEQGDPDPVVAVTATGADPTSFAESYFARGSNGRLIDNNQSQRTFNLGGILASGPGVASALDGDFWVHIAALINDHGHPGVWLKYYGWNGYVAPCNYNAPGTCGQCGCDLPDGFACSM
jgi:hypothetical protein